MTEVIWNVEKADFKEKRSGITLASGRAVSGRHGYGANDYTARATTDPWTVPATD